MDKIFAIVDEVREKAPLVHSITNYVTVNDCANVILACGASPVMAEDERECEEITALSSALALNTGTLSGEKVRSMELSGHKANELGLPVILDPVGAGASSFRTESVLRLSEKIRLSAVKGNISEITTLLKGRGNTSGVDTASVDAVTEDNLEEKIKTAEALSRKLDSVVAVTGAVDIVTDGVRTSLVRNGHPVMSRITGTGCMLTALAASFCAAEPENIYGAVLCAVSAMGFCGERAWEKASAAGAGTGTFRTLLIDEVSLLTSEKLERGAKIETRA